MSIIDTYAAAVVSGSIPAGKYHRLACVRHQRDMARQGTPDFPYRFDLAKAERFFRFAAKLKHYRGEWAGQFIVLEPFQLFRLGSLFGWLHVETGLRRFRASYNEIPRKSGKSLEAAIVALYGTFYDGEPGAEGYTLATKRSQAKIVHGDCKQLVKSSGLKTRIQVRVSNLHREDTASKLEPLGADHDSTDGLNPHIVILDEAHAMKDRGLIDVMETATGARRQPIIYWITTAGNDPVSPCGDQHDYACKVLDRVIDDETLFVFIAHADESDDWQDEQTWRKANPNYGVSVKADDMRALALKAKSMPGAAATFMQKRLNIWVNTDAPWLSLDGWRRGQSHVTREAFIESLRGQTCYAGLDLSSKIDLTALALMFPPTDDRKTWALVSYLFTPDETLQKRAHRDRAPYQTWVNQGWLRTTLGNRIDQQAVRDALTEADDLFDLKEIGVDPWNASNLMAELRRDGFDEAQLLEVPQTFGHLSGPSKDFEADVLDGLVDANSDPLMAWMVSNAVVQRDGKDNIQPIKKKSRGRIDGVVAAVIARKLAGTDDAPEPSVYLTRGVRTLGS